MVIKMKYFIDLHNHTIVSGHAYSTMKEMIGAAAKKGVTHLGFSEHAPKMPGSCHELYFHNLKIMPKNIMGVNILYGCEANIINYEGRLDMRPGILKRLDYVIASMHLPCIQPGSLEENTNAMIKALENPLVNILGHPDDDRYPIDFEKVVVAAKDNHKLIEINNSSLNPSASRVGAAQNDIILLELCKKYKTPILLGSDAHYEDYVCEFDMAEQLLEEQQFPQELVANSSYELLYDYLKKE